MKILRLLANVSWLISIRAAIPLHDVTAVKPNYDLDVSKPVRAAGFEVSSCMPLRYGYWLDILALLKMGRI